MRHRNAPARGQPTAFADHISGGLWYDDRDAHASHTPMTIIAAERRIEQVFEREHRPGGLWAALARHADEPTLGVGDIWRGLERRLLTVDAPPAATGLWPALAARTD